MSEKEISTIEDIMREANMDVAPEPETVEAEGIESTDNADVETTDENLNDVEDTPIDNTSEQSTEIDDGEEVVEDYKPSYSYSVKGEDKEFDARLQGIIKTKEDEDFIRDLVTKSDGLDSYKEKLTVETGTRTALEESIAEMTDKLNVTSGFYQDLVARRDEGDHRSVMKTLGYDEDTVLKMALEIAAERELPTEQRQQAMLNRQTMESNRMLQAQNQQVQDQLVKRQRNDQASAEQDFQATQSNDLNGFIEGEYSDLSKALSEKGINPFEEAVLVGNRMFIEGGRKAEPAVIDVMRALDKKYSWMKEAPAPQQRQQRRETLPNVGGGNVSVIESQVTSIEDIQKEINKMTGSVNY